MGKSDFLTPKAIANRIKAKGLQKLRWYCQMCQKQCRDENGFKCHCLSESHQRQMAVFGQNPHRVVEGFSDEFQEGFLDLMRRSHRHSRVAATVVYNEYIADRHHVHMNATKWATLTEFVTHLSRAGLCKADHTEKGWFITYIDRDSETLFKERLRVKRARADVADEDRQERAIQAQIARAVSHLASSFVDPAENGPSDGNGNGSDDAPVDPPALNGKVAFSLKPLSSSKADSLNEAAAKKPPALAFQDEPEKISKKGKTSNVVSGKSALDELMIEEEKVKEKKNRKDYWLCEGIVVKVLCKALADKGYYKKKGVVKKVIDTYVGEIEMLDNKHVLRVDQEELETVIPQIGGLVRIVNGAYRGSYARLLSVDMERFCAKVQIEKGVYDGRVLSAVEYEDICKVLSEGN